jgi:hypothetical protein
MTSADDTAKAVMRTYADNLQPPPVAEIIARAEHTRENPHPPSTARPRSRGRLVLAAASVAAAIAAVAIAADQLPDRDTTVATQPTASTGANRTAPACPPGLAVLDGVPLAIDGTASKPIAVEAGQQLTLPVRILPSDPDRRLLSFMIYLLPPRADLTTERYKVVSQSPVLRLAPDQQRVSPVLQLSTGLAPGTYDIVGYATFPSPSVCGHTNPANSTQTGAIWGVLGSVVIN